MSISKKKFDEIRNILVQLQDEYGIEIIFAIESGSRLWGLSSNDSDYDIRFVYKRPISQYLEIIQDTRDTIEILDDEIDIVGWDISKFLSLLYKSNPSALEWLKADIIYLGDKSELEKYTEYVNPKKLFFHYRSLSFSQYVRYIESKEKVVLKKYLYLMRGIINALYVLEYGSVPFANLEDTIEALSNNIFPENIRKEIFKIIQLKKSSKELGIDSRNRTLNQFAVDFYDKLEQHQKMFRVELSIDKDIINSQFIKIIGYKDT